ncbi:DUF3224 domain-containing protein [Arsukibacterium sp.]|uniref:DUF3224 domain-containing protein n=1 Tax=Arsukibacterium sp. TaxID=1977258 RepID=UPI003568A7C3
MTTKLNGTFQITGWDESPYLEDDDGTKQSHAKITQTYSGEIEGSSQLQYLMSYQIGGSALFVGFETVSASVNGKSGSFVVQHTGKFEAGVATSNFEIVPNSGKSGLSGISGKGFFKSGENGQANYEFTIND